MVRAPRLLVVALAVALGLTLTSCASNHAPISPQRVEASFGPPGIRGVAYHGTWASRDAGERAAILDAVAASGVTWVRMDVGWADLQPDGPQEFDAQAVARLDERLQEIAQRGLQTLVMFWWAPQWSSGTADKRGIPADPRDYARAAAWIVQRWPTSIDALQVWNEPNLPEFFASTSAADYAGLLKATYPAVKQVRPDVPVVTAGPAHLDRAWYGEFFAQGVSGSYDALGAHLYPVPGDESPDYCRRPDSGCDISWLDQVMQERGDTSPIWVTEFGWSTHPPEPGLQPWERGVTEQQQAAYTADVLALLGTIPRVHAAFVYRDRDFTDMGTHLDGFGILRADNSPKPVYAVLACASVELCRAAARG